MFIAVVALGKPSQHLMTKTAHVRGIWAMYEVPVFDELSIMNATNDTIPLLVQREWIKTAGFVHVDCMSNIVYIGRNDTGFADVHHYTDSINWQHIVQRINNVFPIEYSFLVKIERMK